MPNRDASRYRGRKGYPAINVLVACTFDLKFTYVLSGWEGTTSDSRIVKYALTRYDKLLIPDDGEISQIHLSLMVKYGLINGDESQTLSFEMEVGNRSIFVKEINRGRVDGGLPHRITLIAPYRGIRYHLKEYSARAPQNLRELFNLRHSLLRNFIEQAFSVLKKIFPIIRSTTELFYSCDKQSDIFLACCILNNFLLEVDHDKELEDEVINEMLDASHDEEPHGPRDTDDRGEQIRNSIANDMWIIGKKANDEATKNETDGATTKELFSWNKQMDAAFIEAMLKEQNARNRPNETFLPHAYNNMVKALSDKFNITFNKDKLKNRIKTLKKYFSQFHDVFQGVALSGYAWNSSTRLIEAEDDVWEALKKDKPDVYKLKTKQVNCYDEMYALWAKDRATDNIGTSDDIHVTSQKPQLDGKLLTKSKSKKRKVIEEDPSQDRIANSLDNIVHALDKNSKVIENSRPHVYTKGQIYEELKCLGLEREDIHTAYAY
ncbi:Myb/SANT-like domain-containing protein [Tanacetum coccineum]